MRKITFAALLAASTVLGATVEAHAAFIKGDLTLVGALDSKGLGSGPIVSALSTIPTLGTVVALLGDDAYAGVVGLAGTIAPSWDIPIPGNPPVPGWLVVNGFTFDLESASGILGGAAFSCDAASGGCTDSASFTISGTVSAPGFDDSAFTGSFAMTATCSGVVTCTESPVGSFTVSIVSSGTPPDDVPAPATLALFGAALAGLGLARRRG